jgi:hypothetical protein
VLAIALAIFIAGPTLAYVHVAWNPGYYGDLGVGVCPPAQSKTRSGIVAYVAAGSPADKAGIRLGDAVDTPRTLRERIILCTWEGVAPLEPHPGERITLAVSRGAEHRLVTLQARPLPPLPLIDRLLVVLKSLWLLTFLAIALALVSVRPNKMTWGFYLFALNLVLVIGDPPIVLSYLPIGWFVGWDAAHDVIAPAGLTGFLIFCIRFPANAPAGWRISIERLAPYLGACTAVMLLYGDVTYFFDVPLSASFIRGIDATFLAIYFAGAAALLGQYAGADILQRREIRNVGIVLFFAMIAAVRDVLVRDGEGQFSILALFILGSAVFMLNYRGARGLERHRIKWVALGFACVLCASAVDFLLVPLTLSPPWFVSVLEVLYLALPLTVAYAVIRHRVIDIRFAASRTLTFAVIASIIVLSFIAIDWLFTARLPSSRFEAALYAGLALVIGFSLDAGRQRIGKTVDYLFFREWHRAQAEANMVVQSMSHAACSADLREPLTAGIANAFSLASIALFDRIEDGGFVRVADCGWPAGLTWHLLPNDPVTLRIEQRSQNLNVDALLSHEKDLPSGVARPTTMFPVVIAKHVLAILLCGSHQNGTALDADEIQAIRRACADAAFTYSKSSRSQSGLFKAVEHEQAAGI